ncbi:MAG: phosphoenolpyruvate carboxykinase, partial [Pseudonocardiaceae bacterium]
MTVATIPGLDDAPISHSRLLNWVRDIAELTNPDRVEWCDGSQQEWERLTAQLVDAGTVRRLARKPNSFWAVSDPADVARVEERTFICSQAQRDCGPTNNWMHPDEMKSIMTGLYRGCMRGRTMYVVPFCMGPLGDAAPKLGVEITDSAYVVCSMKIMTRMGEAALRKFISPDGGEAD